METRKPFTWPFGLADQVFLKILNWERNYDRAGSIYKSKRVPHERYGEDMPETKVLLRKHEIKFTYSQIEWLTKTLQLEDPDTTQARIFEAVRERFEEMQRKGKAPDGIQLPFEMAMTHDEVKYVRMLLQCIGKWRRPTPSERKLIAEAEKKGVSSGNW